LPILDAFEVVNQVVLRDVPEMVAIAKDLEAMEAAVPFQAAMVLVWDNRN